MKLKNVLLIFSITVIMANSMAIFAAEKLIGKDIEKPLLSSEEKGTDRKAVTYGALNADTLPLTTLILD